jgi:hypothetical protein
MGQGPVQVASPVGLLRFETQVSSPRVSKGSPPDNNNRVAYDFGTAAAVGGDGTTAVRVCHKFVGGRG